MPLVALIWASLLPFYQVPSMNAFRSVSLSSYLTALQYPGVLNAEKNSLLLAVVGGCVTMFLSAIISWIVIRSRMLVLLLGIVTFAGRKYLQRVSLA